MLCECYSERSKQPMSVVLLHVLYVALLFVHAANKNVTHYDTYAAG